MAPPPSSHHGSKRAEVSLIVTKALEAWPAAFERLLQRFQAAGPELVAQALIDASGHAGRAAAVLRPSAGDCSLTISPEKTKVRYHWERTSERDWQGDASSETTALRSKGSWKGAESVARVTETAVPKPKTFCDRQSQRGADAELVERLAQESRRLRAELQAALAEAQSERQRADRLAAQMAASRCKTSNQARPSPEDLRPLLAQLEASRIEGKRLQEELRSTMAAANAGVGSSPTASEREKLRQELDVLLAKSKEGVAETTESGCTANYNEDSEPSPGAKESDRAGGKENMWQPLQQSKKIAEDHPKGFERNIESDERQLLRERLAELRSMFAPNRQDLR